MVFTPNEVDKKDDWLWSDRVVGGRQDLTTLTAPVPAVST